MDTKTLEESFKVIDQIAETGKIKSGIFGDDEATCNLIISSKTKVKNFEPIVTESFKQSEAGFESPAADGFKEELISLNLSDVEIEEYEQAKIKEYLADPHTEGLPDVAITYRTADKTWVLLEDYSYKNDNGQLITAKKGFETDLASIPRVFWLITASHELSIPAPLYHDLLYRNGGKLPADQVNPYIIFTRKDTDNLFFELMGKSDIPRWRRNVAYQAVRRFAGGAWKG